MTHDASTPTTSPLLESRAFREIGVAHAFTTRVGGVSAPPFHSFNFGNPGALPSGIAHDPKSSIVRNFGLLLEMLGVRQRTRRIAQVHQVHGADVLILPRSAQTRLNSARQEMIAHALTWESITGLGSDFPPLEVDWGSVRADAIVTDCPHTLAVVRVADCAPVLLTTADGRVVGAVHAGWRGVIAGVIESSARAVRELAADSSVRVLGAIGPCIGVEHFEVGPEVVQAFRSVFDGRATVREHPDPARREEGRALVDLRGAIQVQLARAGVEVCSTPSWCTVSGRDLYFSHRRDKGVTGRMVGAILPGLDVRPNKRI